MKEDRAQRANETGSRAAVESAAARTQPTSGATEHADEHNSESTTAKTCPICGSIETANAKVCMSCMHVFGGAPEEQPRRYIANEELVTCENVAALCLTLMCKDDERYVYFEDLWSDLKAEMTRGNHYVEYGEDMGAAVFAVKATS